MAKPKRKLLAITEWLTAMSKRKRVTSVEPNTKREQQTSKAKLDALVYKLRNLPPDWKRSEYLAIVEALADLSYEIKLKVKRAKVIWTEATGRTSVEDLELSRELRQAKCDADSAGFDMDIDHPYGGAEDL